MFDDWRDEAEARMTGFAGLPEHRQPRGATPEYQRDLVRDLAYERAARAGEQLAQERLLRQRDAQEIDRLREERDNTRAVLVGAREERDIAESELQHWRANHDHQVTLKRRSHERYERLRGKSVALLAILDRDGVMDWHELDGARQALRDAIWSAD
jgi:hypothetical protein